MYSSKNTVRDCGHTNGGYTHDRRFGHFFFGGGVGGGAVDSRGCLQELKDTLVDSSFILMWNSL